MNFRKILDTVNHIFIFTFFIVSSCHVFVIASDLELQRMFTPAKTHKYGIYGQLAPFY